VQAGAAPVSGGSNIATKLSNTFGGNLTPEQKASYAKGVTAPNAQPTPAPVQIKNTAPSTYNPTGFLEGTLGGTVKAADTPGQYDFNRNLAQGIASTLGGGIDTVGKFIQNVLGYSPGEAHVSENLQSFGNSPQASKDYGIVNNIKQAVNSIVNPKPAAAPAPIPKASGGGGGGGGGGSWGGTPAKPAQQNVVQQVSNWLRSLFK
jgi:hypothetical protein